MMEKNDQRLSSSSSTCGLLASCLLATSGGRGGLGGLLAGLFSALADDASKHSTPAVSEISEKSEKALFNAWRSWPIRSCSVGESWRIRPVCSEASFCTRCLAYSAGVLLRVRPSGIECSAAEALFGTNLWLTKVCRGDADRSAEEALLQLLEADLPTSTSSASMPGGGSPKIQESAI